MQLLEMSTEEFIERVKELANDDITYWQNEINYLKGSTNYLDLMNIDDFKESIKSDLRVLNFLERIEI